MPQASLFTTGGGVVHKAHLPSSDRRFSVWFDAQGRVIDAEGFGRRGRSGPVSEAQRAELRRRYAYLITGVSHN